MDTKQKQGRILTPIKVEDLVKEAFPVSEKEMEVVALATAPTVKAAATIEAYSESFGDVSLPALVLELSHQADNLTSGDLTRAENILAVQAHTLDAIFNNLAGAAVKTNRLDHMDHYLRLALKAQAQCRTTLEALRAIKNPQNVAFIKQANIGNAVQVNNGTMFDERGAKHEKDEYSGKQTIGDYPNKRLVPRAARPTGRSNSDLEAVEKLDRSSYGSGKSKSGI